MSPDPSFPQTASSTGVNELILNLDFVPTWARQPAVNPYENATGEDPREGRDRKRGRFDRSHSGGRSGPSRGERPPRREHSDERSRRGRDARREERAPARLPIAISFLPERQQLSALVRQLQSAQKAYPLNLVAHLLLDKPEFHLIKIEARGDLQLWQFKPDGAVFLDQESLRAHAIRLHLSQIFDETVEEGEPPAGNFNCVGRCTLTGEWLGPPNYHGYQERLRDLQRTRFPHMKLDDYRARVEFVREPEAIEQWKEQARTRRVYRPKGEAEATPISREEAVQQLSQKYLPGMIQSGRRFILSASVARELPDGPLRRQLEDAWIRESRHPFTMPLSLSPAFKHMGLHLFKSGKGGAFVTAIVPKPLQAEFAVENIRAMLALIREHPGWNRAQLLEHLKPGAVLESPEAAELLQPLRWLVDKGHVIEFFNGTLSAPREPQQPPAPRVNEPAAEEPSPVQDAQE